MSFWEWLAAFGGLSAGWWMLGYFMGRDAGRRVTASSGMER